MKLIEQEYNPVTGITTRYWLRNDGKITVQGLQDADPILDANAQQMGAHTSKGRRDYGEGLGTMVARIPMGLIEEIQMKKGINLMTCDEATLKRFLNSPEYARLRTAPGRI
jgi:hypothetical protein